jgi:hypothetical protein
MTEATHTAVFPVRDYDLAATLGSGQAFRWEGREDGWHGVVGSRPVRLLAEGGCLKAFSHTPQIEWGWLTEYLQTGLNLGAVLATFPADGPLGRAVAACRGLRLLRQEPWECLASFILSSTKQIVQIRQIVALLCERFGDSLAVARGSSPVYSFPSAARLAGVSEAAVRTASFVCALVAVRSADDPQPLVALGRWPGVILSEPRGHSGFGYDPLMFIPELQCAVAEMSAVDKNARSHRGRASRDMLQQMREVWLLG